MKKLVSVLLLSLPMIAGASNCEEVSAKIADKIQNNGVDASRFELKHVSVDESQQVEGKVVGSCDGGRQKIIYVRLNDISASSPTESTAPAKPDEISPTPEKSVPDEDVQS